MDLTLKQKLFVENYLQTRNAYESAKEAGYSGDDATLRSIASENLTKPNIRAEIDKRLRGNILSANQVLAELSEVAFADWREFIEIITDKKTGEVIDAKLRLGDKLKALELVGKYHKIFTDRLEFGSEDLDAAVERELERMASRGEDSSARETESETIN